METINKTKNSKEIQANFLLLITALIWGGGLVAQWLGMWELGPFISGCLLFRLCSLLCSVLGLAFFSRNSNYRLFSPGIPTTDGFFGRGSYPFWWNDFFWYCLYLTGGCSARRQTGPCWNFSQPRGGICGFWGWLLIKEVLTSRAIFGSFFMLGGIMISQIWGKKG